MALLQQLPVRDGRLGTGSRKHLHRASHGFDESMSDICDDVKITEDSTESDVSLLFG